MTRETKRVILWAALWLLGTGLLDIAVRYWNLV
jgi:hypothetical protein